jgi:hypothetical protein
MTTPENEALREQVDPDIPRKVLLILVSWGLAVLVLAGLLSAWIWNNQQDAARDRDGALCALISIFLTGPEPVEGPAGDRSRSVREGMKNYQAVLDCTELDRPG